MSVETDIEELQADTRALEQTLRNLLFVSLKSAKDPKKFLKDFQEVSEEDAKNRKKIAWDFRMQGKTDLSSKMDDMNDAVDRIYNEMVEGISIGD